MMGQRCIAQRRQDVAGLPRESCTVEGKGFVKLDPGPSMFVNVHPRFPLPRRPEFRSFDSSEPLP